MTSSFHTITSKVGIMVTVFSVKIRVLQIQSIPRRKIHFILVLPKPACPCHKWPFLHATSNSKYAYPIENLILSRFSLC